MRQAGFRWGGGRGCRRRKSGIEFESPPRHLHLDLGIMVVQVAGGVFRVGAGIRPRWRNW